MEERPAEKLKDGQVPVTKGFFDQILTYMFDGAQISSVGLLVDRNALCDHRLRRFSIPGRMDHRGNPSILCLEPWYGLCAPDGYKGELKDRPGIQKLEAWELGRRATASGSNRTEELESYKYTCH